MSTKKTTAVTPTTFAARFVTSVSHRACDNTMHKIKDEPRCSFITNGFIYKDQDVEDTHTKLTRKHMGTRVEEGVIKLPVFIIATKYRGVFIQPVDDVFICTSNEDDEVLPKNIKELSVKDSVLVYDEKTEGYVVEKLIEVICVSHYERELMFPEMESRFDSYVTYAHDGIVVNGFLFTGAKNEKE